MSTSTPESRELLRLYKCVVETGTGVLTAFAQNKLLAAYNGNIKQFLDDKKHELFHLWQSKKLSCCDCPPAGYNFKRMSHMDNWIFKKLYADNGPENRSHILRNGRDVVQVCLHKYVTQNTAIHELDISAISFLLRNLIILPVNETTTLDIITTTRSKICHAYSIKCYPMTLLNTMWTELENALIDLTDSSYKWSTRQQIKYLRKIDLEKEEITELLSNVEEVLKEVKSSSNNNVAYLNGMETRLINKSIKNTDAINRHVTEETNYYAAQAQQALSEKIQKTEENLQKEVKEVKKSQENIHQKIGTELHETRSGIKEVKENQEKTQVTLVEMSRTIKNLEMFVKYERPNVLVPEEACSDAMERPVLWQIATPEHWNLEAVEATLRSQSQKDESFKIKFVKKGSLIMLTTIAASVLGDSKAFEAAVMSFLTKMIEDCGINTEIPGRVDVRLHILNANEVSISCELPLGVRHEQTSGIKKEIAESVTTDVAFLNGDDIKEIQWVQNVSKKLKTKFDVNCAILSKDYLNGFPLRKSLGQYVHMFKAVIVTITKENHELYDYFIEDDMSVIAVELDFINKVSLNLRKCQHINCTICEHLWFPQLMNILKITFPDHLRKNIENYTDEVDVNCEKCMQSVTTFVFHGIELQKAFNQKRLILCCSLTDEAWILNLLYQMTNFTEPYRITTWIKSIGISFPFSANTVVALISPNSSKCEQFNRYINYFTHTTLCVVEIAPTERPSFSRFVDCYMYATSMTFKELADKILSSAEKYQKPLLISQGNVETEVDGQDVMHVSFDGAWQKRGSGRCYNSLTDEFESYKQLNTTVKKNSSVRSDYPDDGTERLKLITSVNKDRCWRSDYSGDGTERLKQQKTSVKKGRNFQPDDFIDNIGCSEIIDTRTQAERTGEPDNSVDVIESIKKSNINMIEDGYAGSDLYEDGEIDMARTRNSIGYEKGKYWQSDASADNEWPSLESNVRFRKVRSRISDSKCIIQ